jgi:hypothetical protein
MTAYERLTQRIADGKQRGEDVSTFEAMLIKLPRPQHLVEYDRQVEAGRKQAEFNRFRRESRIAIAELRAGEPGAMFKVLGLIDRAVEHDSALMRGK